MNPYENLNPRQYWRTGVADQVQHEIFDDLWRPRFSIDKHTKFITSGSCFAQHISKWIEGNGYSWIDSEPANASMPNDIKSERGYGVFSFRTGNIYTPALLRQWTFQALGLMPPLTEVFVVDGKYFDPFRPLIPKGGYSTYQELENERFYTLRCIHEALMQADVFIFTLGLSEAWENRLGYVYPICPGTLRGKYDLSAHVFVNYSYDRILKDLIETFDAIKSVNKKIKFLLTVSPVPLTATATTEHALTATTYSKSVLRAAAGKLTDLRDDVDYFPSYELISQFPTFGKFYEPNLRSIKSDGVNYVMKHFEDGISPNISKRDSIRATSKIYGSIDDICEDVLLDPGKKMTEELTSVPHVFFLGDSHMGILSGFFDLFGILRAGDMTMKGHMWAEDKYLINHEEIFIPLQDFLSRKNWSAVYDSMLKCEASPRYVITNIGIQTNFNIPKLINSLVAKNKTTVSAIEVGEFFLKQNQGKIAILEKIINCGFTCIVITDPPTQGINPGFKPLEPLIRLYETEACKHFERIGCQTINTREVYPDGIPHHFYRDEKFMFGNGQLDYVHGSDLYYEDLAKKIISKFGLK